MTGMDSRHILRIGGLMTMLLAAAILCAYPADGTATYYVSHDGSDINPGTKSKPFRTVQKGITQSGLMFSQ